MFCAACGNNVVAGERFCRVCGREVPAITPPPVPSSGVAHPAPGAPAETSGKAIVSLICGLLFFLLPFSIVAIIFGHLSLSDIRKSAGRLTGQGIAIAGLVLGYLGIAAIPVILIIAAIAIPNLLRARMEANEASALGSIRTLVAAEVGYAATRPETGFACSLSELQEANLIHGPLVSGKKSGYVFEISNCTHAQNGRVTRFDLFAYPQTQNQTGMRVFCADESGAVRMSENGSKDDCLANGKPEGARAD
jgi:type IV pilus assembly protein PilA